MEPCSLTPPASFLSAAKQQQEKQLLINLLEEIFGWMYSLPLDELYSVLTISCKRDVGLMTSIFGHKELPKKGFSLTEDGRLYYRSNYRYKLDTVRKEEIESELIKAVRMREDREVISLKKSLIKDRAQLFRMMRIFTNQLIFCYEKTSPSLVQRSSQWFKQTKHQSGIEWFVHCLEAEILNRWTTREKPYTASSNNQYITDFQHYIVKLLQTKNVVGREHIGAFIKAKYNKEKKAVDGDRLAFEIATISKICQSKPVEELVEDIVFKRIATEQDELYLQYCAQLREDFEGSYSIYVLQLDEVMKAAKKSKNSKSKKRRKNTKQKKGQQQADNAQQEADGDDASEENVFRQAVESSNDIHQVRSEACLPEQPPIQDIQEKQVPHSMENLPTEQPPSPPQHHNNHHKHASYQQAKQKRKLKAANAMMSQMLQSFVDDINFESNNYVQYRKNAFVRIEQGIKSTLLANHIDMEYALQLFGSCALGLSTITSDIDVVLSANCTKSVQELVLKCLAQYFQSLAWVKTHQLILHTTVPVLKLDVDVKIDCKENPRLNLPQQKIKRPVPVFTVDLSLECHGAQNHLGIKSTSFMKDILQQHPTLRSIIILVKLLLRARNLHLTYLGGMNSYVLFLLIYSVYRHFKLQDTPLFKATIEVLHYIGADFDHTVTAIDISLPKQPINQWRPLIGRMPSDLDWDRLTIVNPLSENPPLVNTSCYLFRQVKKCMLQLHNLMLAFRRQQLQQQTPQPKPKDLTLKFKQSLKSFLQ